MSERYAPSDDFSSSHASDPDASNASPSDTSLGDEEPTRPDAAVVDHLVAVAGSRAQNRLRDDASGNAHPPASERSDRSAHPMHHSSRLVWARRAQRASVLVALAVLVSLSVWSSPDETRSSAPVASEVPVKTFPAQQQTASALPPSRAMSLPSWDDTDDVVRLHQRIEMVHARSASSDWMTVSAGR